MTLLSAVEYGAGIGGSRLALDRAGFVSLGAHEPDEGLAKIYSQNYVMPDTCRGDSSSLYVITADSEIASPEGFEASVDIAHTEPAFVVINRRYVPKASQKIAGPVYQWFKLLGYDWVEMNLYAGHYVPQDRVTHMLVFAHQRLGYDVSRFRWPITRVVPPAHAIDTLSSILLSPGEVEAYEIETGNSLTLSEDAIAAHMRRERRYGRRFVVRILDPEESCAYPLYTTYGKDPKGILIYQHDKAPRRLAPRECARLMGFPDTYQIVGPELDVYRGLALSPVIPVLTEVLHKVHKVMGDLNGVTSAVAQ